VLPAPAAAAENFGVGTFLTGSENVWSSGSGALLEKLAAGGAGSGANETNLLAAAARAAGSTDTAGAADFFTPGVAFLGASLLFSMSSMSSRAL
jgi:hypothetical protein